MEKFVNEMEVTCPLKLLFQVLRFFGLVSLSFFSKNNYESERRSIITNAVYVCV